MENTIFQQMEEHGPRACRFLNVEHHYHSSYQKSIIKRTIQYMKDRTECFDDYFPSKKDNDCKQMHVMNWLGLFVDMHARTVMEKIVKWTSPTHS
jgi:putative transposase